MTRQTKSWFIKEGFRSWLIAMIAAVLIVGTILTWWMVQRVDREMREVLLLEARLVERSLNVNRIRTLTGTDADLENPDYRRLKEQLTLIRKSHQKCRFLYLMGRKADGNLFLHVDSESTDSKDYSPPGQPYREAPEGYRRVFDTRDNATVGPVSDRWGRWITALVPIIDPTTNNLIAVMGMDIDAATWKTDLAANAALPASSMLALMITLASLMFAVRSMSSLRESKMLHETILETTGTAISILEEDRTISFVNKEFETMSGYPREEIEGKKSWTDFTFREDLDDMLTRHRQRRANGESPLKQYEFRFVDKEGRIRNIFLHVDMIPGTRKSIAALLDITDRKKAEESLEEAQRQLADIIDFLPDATFVIDKAGKVIAWNRAIEALTGVGKENMLGRGDREYALPFYGERKPTLIDLVLQPREEVDKNDKALKWQGNVLTGEVHIPSLAGKEVYLLGTASILYDTKGSVVGAIETIRDVTDRIRMERQVHQAQKMEAIGALAGGIAHDFNNILGAIMGYTELYREQVRDRPKVYHAMGEVFKATCRARDLVQQILTFSRRTAHEKRPTAVTPIIQEVAGFIRASLPRTIEIRQKLNLSSDMILADETQVHQVLMNLCTNAGQAMADKGGILEIGLEEVFIDEKEQWRFPSLPIGRYLRLDVRDTGHGIGPEDLGKIFDPYFTTKGKGEGTGLGLAVVHGIVKEHGGEIRVYSEIGTGSLFSVYLPLMEKPSDIIRPPAEPALPRGNERILFIDDEEALVNLGKEFLEGLGYRVVAETDPLKAIEEFGKNSDGFDLVITDKTMPHMTGFDVVREMRKIRADIPVILCSGFQEKEDLEKQSAIGIRFFIMKPVRMHELADVVRMALKI